MTVEGGGERADAAGRRGGEWKKKKKKESASQGPVGQVQIKGEKKREKKKWAVAFENSQQSHSRVRHCIYPLAPSSLPPHCCTSSEICKPLSDQHTSDSTLPSQHTTMGVLATVAGFSTFGLAARGFALGVQRRPLASGKGSVRLSDTHEPTLPDGIKGRRLTIWTIRHPRLRWIWHLRSCIWSCRILCLWRRTEAERTVEGAHDRLDCQPRKTTCCPGIVIIEILH
jgi:hypothetical protein